MRGILDMDAHVGTSGWQYDDWRGVGYPQDLPKRLWFDHYCTHFGTVEIGSTFYRLPSEATLDRWSTQAPPAFLYSPKLGGFCTHRRKLAEPHTWLPNHLERIRRLGAHLGSNLVQLPPRWHRNTDRLDEFLSAAPDDVLWAVELRDESWLHDDTFEVLRRHGAALWLARRLGTESGASA